MSRLPFASALAVLALAGACAKESATYCANHPDDLENCPAGGPDGGGGTACTDDTACPGGVCELATGTCVECTVDQPAACTGTTPVCVANACAACQRHADCASQVCLADGSCADEAAVAYVDGSASDANDCSRTARCATITKALTADKPIVKIDGNVVESTAIALANRDLTLLAETTPQATVTRANAGPIVRVDGTGAVAIHGLQIANATGASTGIGLQVEAGFEGTLVVDRVKLYDNAGGGLFLNGAGRFTVTNSVFAHNGTAVGSMKSVVGGVAITNDSLSSRFEGNTVAFNRSNGLTYRGGISCNATMPSASGNLVYQNSEPDGNGGLKFDAGTQRNSNGCAFGTTAALFNEPGHLGFASPLDAPLDFHLTASAPATVIDAGGACTGTDLDGAARPLGAGCDLGADEAR